MILKFLTSSALDLKVLLVLKQQILILRLLFMAKCVLTFLTPTVTHQWIGCRVCVCVCVREPELASSTGFCA